jgi:excisionase family DNA binding protein
MTPLATIPLNHARRTRPGARQPPQRTRRAHFPAADPARFAIPEPDSRGIPEPRRFTPLIDAKAASELLGVPYTWLLAQARERRIPHHRLGHYVRFNPDDLRDWLNETRSVPRDTHDHAHRGRL